MKLSVIQLDGKAAGDVELSDAVFGISDIRGDILARYVNWQLAKRRAGTHKVQTRNENSRTGKKMYKQKGTGGARHGSRRAAQFVGGAKAHGPTGQQNFNLKLTRKMKRLSLFSALTQKLKDQEVIAVSGLDTQKPKTKIFAQIIQKLAPKAKNATLILAPKPPANIVTATKNLPRLSVTSADKLTTYQALSSHQLIFTEKSLKSLTDHYAG